MEISTMSQITVTIEHFSIHEKENIYNYSKKKSLGMQNSKIAAHNIIFERYCKNDIINNNFHIFALKNIIFTIHSIIFKVLFFHVWKNFQ